MAYLPPFRRDELPWVTWVEGGGPLGRRPTEDDCKWQQARDELIRSIT
jgi:hypothetical protein